VENPSGVDHRRGPIRLRRDAVAWREVDGEIVALDLTSSTYLRVNPSGTTLWGLIVEGTTYDALAATLVESYGLDGARAEREVDDFVAMCAEWGLLEPEHEGR